MPSNTPTFELVPRPRADNGGYSDIGPAISAMGYNYGTDYEFNPSSTNPNAPTNMLNGQPEFDDMFNWLLGTPPTWEQLLNVLRIVRINTTTGCPGDLKISNWEYDHGNWMRCPHDVRRQVLKDDFPALYDFIGDTFNDGNTGVDEFGLPMASEVLALVPKSGALSYGDKGGANTVEVGSSGLPEHNHDLLDSIAKKTGTLDVVTNAVLLGIVLTKTTINTVSEIGSSQGTANASDSGTPTEVDIQNPYLVAGNLFIHVGVDNF